MHRLLGPLSIALVIIGGCAKPMEVGSITEIKPTEPGAGGIDVYAARRARGEPVPTFAGDQLLEVRTYAAKEGLIAEEFSGATCIVKSSNFSAEVTTPAKVRIPLYREQSSTLAVSCKKDGFNPKMVDASAFDVTRSQRMQTGSNAGLLGVVFVTAVDAMSDNTQNEWRYPLVRVEMTPVQTADAGKPKS